MNSQHAPTRALSRRALLRGSSLILFGTGSAARLAAADSATAKLRIGLITDLHHADKPAAGSRNYRLTRTKLAEAAERMTAAGVQRLVELGDLIDAADSVEVEQGYLEQINEPLRRMAVPVHYVLGNHCVDMLTKDEFLAGVGQPRSYFSFDAGGMHFVVVDSCYRHDGQPYGRKNSDWRDANVPTAQLDWLRDDLRRSTAPAIVLAHQRLDEAGLHSVRNAAEVRSVLEQAGNVLAVFQGHSHRNAYQQIAGIHYCTLVAMVEGAEPEQNGYALLDILESGALRLTGFRAQATYDWS